MHIHKFKIKKINYMVNDMQEVMEIIIICKHKECKKEYKGVLFKK